MPTTNPSANDPRSGAGLTKSQRRALRAQQQQAQLAARKRKESVRRVVLISVAAIALVALVAVLVLVGKHQGNGGGTVAEPKQEWLNVGNPQAPHKLDIYEDFLCPHCGHLERESETKLQAEAKAGKVYLSYRPFVVLSEAYSGDAVNAYVAVKAIAGDDVALQFHNLLYRQQPDETAPPSDPTSFLTGLADQVVPQADQRKVDDAIKNDSYGETVTQMTKWVSGPMGVIGTPTVYLDGKQYNDESGTHTDPYYGGDENLADNVIKAVQ